MVREIEAPQRAGGMVHHQIADIAKGMAAEHYENLARDNRFLKAFPNQKLFVRKKWPLYIHIARETLVSMLADPKRSEEQKRAIFAVLQLDGVVNPKNMAVPEKPRFFT